MSYLRELSEELHRVGIRGGSRRRVVTEFEDHLRCDPNAELGAPAVIARQFADELGTRRAFRAARASFLALAVAGVAAAVAFLTSGSAGLNVPALHARDEGLGALAGLITALGAQVAFAAGSLAALRAFWRRREPSVSYRDAVVIWRRAAVGAGAGLVTMAGMALFVAEFNQGVANWWTTLVLAGAGVGVVAVLAAAPALVAAARLRPQGEGQAGDLLSDLDPLVPVRLGNRPWCFAIVFAAALAIVIALGGVVGEDPFDGLARGVGDGAACLAGFALLGRYLGLR